MTNHRIEMMQDELAAAKARITDLEAALATAEAQVRVLERIVDGPEDDLE